MTKLLKTAIDLFNENKKRKCNKYPFMKCNKVIQCSHYKGDGYTYRFDNIEFNFCDICNNKLFIQMLEQKKLEQDIEEKQGEKK